MSLAKHPALVGTIIVVALLVVVTTGVAYWLWHAGYFYPRVHVNMTEQLAGLPTPPGAILVTTKRPYMWGAGNSPDCGQTAIDALYGTNDASYPEVLDFYTRELLARSWSISYADGDARVLMLGDREFLVEVSKNYSFAGFGTSALGEAFGRFGTVYFVQVLAYTLRPVPSYCGNG